MARNGQKWASLGVCRTTTTRNTENGKWASPLLPPEGVPEVFLLSVVPTKTVAVEITGGNRHF